MEALSEAEDDDYEQLERLADRMLSQIYGQDEAIRQVVESVQMSRAGLLDDNKPLDNRSRFVILRGLLRRDRDRHRVGLPHKDKNPCGQGECPRKERALCSG